MIQSEVQDLSDCPEARVHPPRRFWRRRHDVAISNMA